MLTLPSYLATIRSKIDDVRLTVILTSAAASFLPPRTVGLICDEVIDSTDPDAVFAANHVRLASSHDLILVLPATANVLGTVATGQAPNLLTAVVLAASRPVIFLPAMNRLMWTKPAVQRNVRQIREDGHEVIEPRWRTSFELASQAVSDNPTLLSPTEVAELLLARLALTRTG